MTPRRRAPLRAVLRFVSSVLVVSGALLIADAVATLLWQEPVSWLVAQQQQSQLRDDLADPPKRVVRGNPIPGDAIGRISIPAIGVDEYIVEGTGTQDLRKGPGHYPETPLPGERGTTAIAGHRTTYGAPFRHIDDLERGQRITIETPTTHYTYVVESTKIVDDSDRSVLDAVGYRRLVLSACHPLYSAEQRVIAFARQMREDEANQAKADAGTWLSFSEDSSRASNSKIRPATRASEIATTAIQ